MSSKIFPGQVSDFNMAVRLGQVPGVTALNIQGHATAMGTGLQTVWSGGASLASTALLGTPATVKVSSSSGTDAAAQTGALTALLSGVSSTNVAQSETITLTGQTAVTSSLTYKGINGLTVVTAGSGLKNVGNLWVGNGSISSGVPATKFYVTEAGDCNGDTGTYTVAAGTALHITQVIMMVADTAKFVDIQLTVNDGSVNRIIAHFELGQGDFTSPAIAAPAIPAGSLVAAQGLVNTGTADVAVLIGGYLVDV